ncbi:uncharacterized protein V1516DRAFT_619875 [Lipomyces oligophaga]|uniref:uncharacterized protein n=1 Tax=Lipomyces oligophaga TaxID=45792 RepID=UPI0034CE536F
MSIDTNWNALTEERHEELSHYIRDFLRQQFQSMTLPSYIANVDVIDFDLGSSAPSIEIKHIGDPYPEFYEDATDQGLFAASANVPDQHQIPLSQPHPVSGLSQLRLRTSPVFHPSSTPLQQSTSPIPPSSGIPFLHHNVLTPSLVPGLRSPLPTPLYSIPGISAAAAAAFHGQSEEAIIDDDDFDVIDNVDHSANHVNYPLTSSPVSLTAGHHSNREDELHSFASTSAHAYIPSINRPFRSASQPPHGSISAQPPPFSVREDDLQFLLHIQYSGDMKIVVTADLRINYPSKDFLVLPIRLTVTGLEVNAMAVLTYMSRRVHFSFISDVGGSRGSSGDGVPESRHFEVLRNVKVESEIGDQEGKGSVLKNVGKVERFVLERLRSIVRDELAWPGWITFEI